MFVGGTLAGAGLSADGLKVTLTTAQPLVTGNSYSVTTHNLATVSGNEVRDGLQIAFVYAPKATATSSANTGPGSAVIWSPI